MTYSLPEIAPLFHPIQTVFSLKPNSQPGDQSSLLSLEKSATNNTEVPYLCPRTAAWRAPKDKFAAPFEERCLPI
jgi:hypothetical protein